MRLEHRPVNFEDGRGEIRDIFPDGAPESVTLISSKKGAIRGNHYHRESTQYAFVVSGRLRSLAKRLDVVDAKTEVHILKPGDLVRHDPNEAHAFVAEEDTVFLAFAKGLRKGDDYELDTYRLAEPLRG